MIMLMVNILNNSYKKKWSRFYKYMGVYPIFFYKHFVRKVLNLQVFSRIFSPAYLVLESKILHLNARAIWAGWHHKRGVIIIKSKCKKITKKTFLIP